MQVDYIIVGLGLAGLAFSHELSKHHKSFVLFENNSQQASKVAGGIYNPIVLKRFTPVWKAHQQIEIAKPFYAELAKILSNKYQSDINIYRLFNSIEEQNNWAVAADKPVNDYYMIPEIISENHNGIKAPFGYGKLQHTGKIDVAHLLSDYTTFLVKKKQIYFKTFDYSAIEFLEEGLLYKGIFAKQIVFCEGFGIKQNPFFNHLPLQESKGELLTIYAPDVAINFLLKSAVFMLPLGNGYFKVGATFNWTDKTSTPSEAGKQELIKKLDTFLTAPYTVVDQHAGIRPTVKDRRPLIGVHKAHKQLAVLNGLGTRGVLIAPSMAKALYHYLEHQKPLDKEVSINRFEN